MTETARALEAFVDDLSNWYVRRCRDRFWAPGMEEDKVNAYMTLYTALVEFAKAAAPMIPFMTEDIYRNLVCGLDADAPESIHLCAYPEVREQWIDEALEKRTKELLQIVVLGRAARNLSGMKNRQPLSRMLVKAEFGLSDYDREIILDELNIKALEFSDDLRVDYSLKPQLKTVGPKFGKQVGAIRSALAQANGAETVEELRKTGSITLQIDGGEVSLGREDLLIEIAQTEGFVTEADQGVTVMLDTSLSPELIEEGFVRELVSKIQTMRKEAGFEVTDRIRLFAQGNATIGRILRDNETQIRREVLADEVLIDEIGGYSKEWSINAEKVSLGVEKMP